MERAYPVYCHVLFDGVEGLFYLESLGGGQGHEGLIGCFDLCLDGSDSEGHVCEWVLSI